MQIATSTDSATKPPAGKANSKGKRASAAKQTLRLKAKQSDAASAGADITIMIATAAYYLAERRGFEPGHELEDWLTAEREVMLLHS